MAAATVITFDDLITPTDPYNPTVQIDNGYNNLTWSNFYALDTAIYFTPSGYQNGTASGQNVAYNGYSEPAVITGSIFDFNGAYLTGAWNNGLNISVTGLFNGNTLYSQTVTVDSSQPTWFEFDFAGIDTLIFSSSGGDSAGYAGGGNHFAMDDFTFDQTIVPIESWTDPTQDLIVGTNGFFGPYVSLTANQNLSEHNLVIDANGHFVQSGGTHAVNGSMTNNGSYTLSGGSLSASGETIGDADAGSNFGYGPSGNFTQTGGTNTVNGTLTLGKQAGSQGTYNLKAGTLNAQHEVIGDAGTGTFNQSGGTNIVNGTLTLGKQAGGQGIYNLLGGVLTALNEIVGDAGSGTFTQGQNNYGYGESASSTNIVGDTLTLGKQASGTGTYNLTSGSLIARKQIIGDAGTGVFNQSGGTNTVSDAMVLGQQTGSHGTYNFINGVLTAASEIIGDAGEGTFTQGESNYGYGSSNPVNSVNGTLTLGKQATGSGTYNLQSGTLTTQQQIIGDAGKGTFNQSGGTNAVNGSLVLGQQAGSVGTYNLVNGVLTALNEIVGDGGEGTFTQGQSNYGYGSTNPTNSVNGTLTLGKQAGSTGTYNLLSGALTAQRQVIGDAGSGTFNQYGGTNTIAGDLVLGQQVGGHGIYNLVEGALVAINQVIGDAGSGTFTQGNNYGYGATNPTNTVTDTLTLGKQVGSTGTYNLISGALSSMRQIIGDAGTGIFNQNGGRNTVSDTLTLAKQTGSSGTYNLQSGELASSNVVVGDGGVGSFVQSGGTHTLDNLVLGKQATAAGSYVLKGGNLNVHGNIEGGSGSSSVLIEAGALNFDAGQHEVAVDKFEIADTGAVNLADNAIATFQGDVIHNGQEIHIGAGGNAIFNGAFAGAGAITGAGTITFNNVFQPGEGPIKFTVEGDMVLGSSSTSMLQIAGLNSGQYDTVDVGGTLTLGGQLQLSSLGGYTLKLGDTFDLFSAEHITGHFDLITSLALGDGLTWQIDYLDDAAGSLDVVRASVVNAVPLPAAIWLLQVPLFGLAAAARMRKRLH